MGHHVAFFNPGSNASQVSRLRLVNPGEDAVEATISGRDDDGESAPGGEVSLTLGPGEAREVSAQELERGGDGLAGSLGDGSGKWQLFVNADGAIEVMNLLRSPTGHLVNLSASRRVEGESSCTGTAVDIPDPSLRRALERALNKAEGAPVTPGEMATLTSLEAFGVGIHSVEGLQCATGLRGLYLEGNHISDIPPLAGLTALNDLNLGNNSISDISPLADLASLERLELFENQISDILSLAGLTALRRLFIGDNRISDISPLAGLTAIRVLHLYKNQISDISPLAGLTALAGLEIFENQISDISPLSDLPALVWMFLDDNQISNISPLAGLTTLGELHLCGNQITDISSLASLTGLYRLEMYDNQITDISPLSGLIRLVGLGLGRNHITDIAPLVSNRGLGSGDGVDLESNPLSDQSRHVHIPALRARGVIVMSGRWRCGD